MLFPSESLVKSKNKIATDLEKGTLTSEQAAQKILDLDPTDHFALGMLALAKLDNGDRAAAREILWRATESQPSVFTSYLQLSAIAEPEALSKGLSELACRKMLRDEEAIENLENDASVFQWTDVPEMAELKAAQRLEVLAAWLHDQREFEPLAVTATLRPHRLIEQILQNDILERQLIDAVVQEAAQEAAQNPVMVSLLIGILRGWIEDLIPESELAAIENSLALLGEIGDVNAIPYLLDTATLEDNVLSAVSCWSLDRVIAQHASEAAQQFEKIASGLDAGHRIVIAETLLRHPTLDPNGSLIEKLFQGLDQLAKEDRDACFQILLTTGMMLHGRSGVNLARTMLRRHGNLLSKTARRDAGEMVEELSSIPITPFSPPEPSPWTVYQLCNGEIDWEKELEKNKEEDEEEVVPLEPLHRTSTPGRNDPCWCGSGKKYKKCHLLADEQEQRKAANRDDVDEDPDTEFDPLRRKIGEMLHEQVPKAEYQAAIKEFFSTGKAEEGIGQALLVDWMVHDRVSETFGRNVMEEYLRRNGSKMTGREREFVESSANSYVDLLEVQRIEKGSGLEVKSLTSSETFFVHDVSMSKAAMPWDGLLSRVIQGERGREFSGTCTQLPRAQLNATQSWMEDDKRRTGLSWPVYLKRNWPRIRTRAMELGLERLSAMEMRNNQGDEFILSKATYQVLNRAMLVASLRSSIELDESEEATRFVWLDGPSTESGRTVLGTIRIVGEQLTFECNSRERLDRGKQMLADLAGAAVKFESEEFTTTQELLREARENPPAPSTDEIPPEVQRELIGQYMEKHYADWPDTKLPALGGKTPRQAVKSAKGKREVIEILKEFENAEARKEAVGEYSYDVSKLRAALGLAK